MTTTVDAAMYEMTLGSEINARIGRSRKCPWTLDGIQLFGNNMPRTALVIQLSLDHNLAEPGTSDPVEDIPIHELYESVEETNNSLGFAERWRVHTGKRTLIVSSGGAFVYGQGSERLAESCISLSLTHKRTPKRWENVYKFKPWLDGLDFSDS